MPIYFCLFQCYQIYVFQQLSRLKGAPLAITIMISEISFITTKSKNFFVFLICSCRFLRPILLFLFLTFYWCSNKLFYWSQIFFTVCQNYFRSKIPFLNFNTQYKGVKPRSHMSWSNITWNSMILEREDYLNSTQFIQTWIYL